MKIILQFILLCCISGLCFTATLQAQTYSGTGGSIPDNGPQVSFIIPVSGLSPAILNKQHGLKKICVQITHPYTGDLQASVSAPDGTTFTLFSSVGGGGQNFTQTCFDSFAVNPIQTASAPFTGDYRPMGNIGKVNNGQIGNGNWVLHVQDVGVADTGSVDFWQITFDTQAPTPTLIKTDIPLVVIETNGMPITDAPSIIQCKIIDHGAGNIHDPADIGNVFQGNAEIHIRGSYSSSLPQKPYRLTLLNNSATTDTNVSLLGMPAEHDWILQATYNDKSFVRNMLMFEMFRKMGHYAARSKFCELVLDGEYQGIYLITEKIKRDSARVDIPKLTVADTMGNDVSGGYIIKHDYYDNGWTSAFSPPACNNRFYDYSVYYPKFDSMQPQQLQFIKTLFDSIEQVLYGVNPYDTLTGYRKYIHMPSFADYLLTNEMAWNNDGYKKSMFFHKYKNSKDVTLHAGPIWDFDWALKRMPWTPADYSGWSYAANPCDGDVLFLPWWDILMQDTNFQQITRCRWDMYRSHFLHTDSINQFIQQQANYLHHAQQRHFDYWQTLGMNVGTPEQAPFAQTYQEEIDTLQSILATRMLWMDEHLPGICKQPIFPDAVQALTPVWQRVYPNPFTQQIHIEAKQQPIAVTLYDISGKRLKQMTTKLSTQIIFPTNDIESGLYILEIEYPQQMKQQIRLVK